MRQQPSGEAAEEWDPREVIWPPEKEIDVSEAHASLVKAVAGSRGVRYFTAFIIDVTNDGYLGDVQMAIDDVAGEACGILLRSYVTGSDAATGQPILAEEATRPFKFPCGGGVAKAIAVFCDKLKMAGVFP
ncbi:hypothetical protein RWK44_31760 [Rhizobium sp. 25PS6]|uniref:Uncharacterized protein n=1 Tax=Rhizobium laguerreae TaxID=1076926 RepID=A0AB35FHN7_9HYPH|nr:MULTISPECIES: hypothetical protein [Rhizobium]AHF82945.1 hypothetical protein RLEG3_14470 [Rhizobium leguminosarum bv. trifolii WSM1689]MBY3066256.1 hypothetical protein [Rhizobium laguerreae]MBY3080725.1 hypothetical protein [Rhizobium laguerreae]MBY3114115.1 hypothetical protein [Rhizobium laguerreae]MBY3180208.1 hypothetical protein [Rhizobium laguerreae]